MGALVLKDLEPAHAVMDRVVRAMTKAAANGWYGKLPLPLIDGLSLDKEDKEDMMPLIAETVKQVTLKSLDFPISPYPATLRGEKSFTWAAARHVFGRGAALKCLCVTAMSKPNGLVSANYSADSDCSTFFFEDPADFASFHERAVALAAYVDGPLVFSLVSVPSVATVHASVVGSKMIAGMKLTDREREAVTVFGRMAEAGVAGRWGACFAENTNTYVLTFGDTADAAALLSVNQEDFGPSVGSRVS